MSKCKMDKRCPRRLEDFPESYCPLAVLRLKALRNAGKELTEEEESRLQGCPYSVAHQLSSYCFFKYIYKYYPAQQLADIEIAHYNSVSVDTVKKLSASAINKMRELDDFVELSDIYADEKIVDDTND